MPPAPPSSPQPLQQAVRRIEATVRAALDRTHESLTLAAATATHAVQRDALLGAQFELNRQSATFVANFARTYDEQLQQDQRRLRDDHGRHSNWDTLSLVDDHEVEIKVQAERIGLEITHACEWELRELEAYVGSVLGRAAAERDANPLRPELIGNGLIRAIESLTDRPELRKVLEAELTRSMATLLRGTYADIVADLRRAGVQPMSLSVRMSEARQGETSRSGDFDARPSGGSSSKPGPLGGAAGGGGTGGGGSGGGGSASGGPVTGSGLGGGGGSGAGSALGRTFGRVEAGMMDLLRRLAFVEPAAPGADLDTGHDSGQAMPANVIHRHREELRRASTGQLDHMVIDVIGSLFDQILSDPKVPPQLARQIARLQLPVLRAALGDPSFFANRRHPVRLFINRIASLGNGFDDFDDAQAQTFLAKVRELVQEIVKGDFERVEVYEARLSALESFVSEQARAAVEAQQAGATALLQQREESLRIGQHYERRLEVDLQPLAAPAFVRDFVVRVWSRVILQAAEREGVTSDRVRALRLTGRELFMSVQPKTSPAQRKAFLAELPKLMQSINAGLNSIGWPEDRRRAFFGQLMPAHAEALKVTSGRVLDFNLMSRQVEQALEKAMPTRADLPPPRPDDPVTDESATGQFTQDEAARIGLVAESSIDWNGKVDIDLSAEPEVRAADLALPGLPAMAEAPEPASGASLAEHVQIGFSYQMHLDGDWQKVRLAHVSPGRTFFVFTSGHRHQRTISLTYRMLQRLCETGRLRAFESAQLLERATARTRRQLAQLGAGSAR